MDTQRYDVVVIGSGPGGEGAAMKACKSGRRVCVVDRMPRVGGACTHRATIPSKALRHVVQRLEELRGNPVFRPLLTRAEITFPKLLQAACSVIDRQTELRQGFYDRNGVDLHEGHARFCDEHTIWVQPNEGAPFTVAADAFVIATGSRPYHPSDVDFDHPRIHDSDTILSLDHTPRTMTIYGAGVVGCEYASIFRGLGVKLNLVNTRDKLLSFLDEEIIDALSYHLRDQGVLIRHNEVYDRIEGHDDGVSLHLRSGKVLKTDILLWANGRSGNTNDLGLSALDIEPNNRGHIPVDANYRTSQPHIYAVGDVVGFPSLASAAYDQSRFAATHLVEGSCDHSLVEQIPTGIYTSPEISSIGPTEAELTEKKIPYEVGKASFRSIARAQITGQTVGMLKILFHRESLEILGIHCFGDQAAEIVHIGQAIMAQKGDANSLNYFINTTFNYPTMAEAYRVAALNGINRVG